MPPKLRGRHLKRYAMLRVFELSQTQVFGIKAKFPLPTLCGRQFFFCAAKEKPEISFPQIIKAIAAISFNRPISKDRPLRTRQRAHCPAREGSLFKEKA